MHTKIYIKKKLSWNFKFTCLTSQNNIKFMLISHKRPKRTWREVVREDCKTRKLNKEDAMDRCKWRKVLKAVRWSGWVSGWVFLLVPAYPGSPGTKAVKRLLLLLLLLLISHKIFRTALPWSPDLLSSCTKWHWYSHSCKVQMFKVISKPRGPLGSSDIHFSSPQPDTSITRKCLWEH